MKKRLSVIFFTLTIFSLTLVHETFAQIPKGNREAQLTTATTPGPSSPIDLHIKNRGVDYLTLSFSDSSKDEMGNRLYRSTDGNNWSMVSELGAITFGNKYDYTDRNLERTKLYYYKVEVYAKKLPLTRAGTSTISSFTRPLKAYTAEGDSVKLFRLQVVIKTADLPNADLDAPLRVDVGINRGKAFPTSVYTFLDYGHDDFERGASFSYDVMLGDDINSLAELGDITISNTTYDDRIIIDSVKIIANNNIVYEKSYLPGSYTLPGLGTLRFSFTEMAVSEKWHQLVVMQRDQTRPPPGLDFFLASQSPQEWAVKIPSKEIISRIEAIVGHSFYSEPKIGDYLKWEEGYNDVKIGYKAGDTIFVALELVTRTFDRRAVKAYFDLAIISSCTSTGLFTMIIKPCNLRYNINFDFLNFLTPGINFVLSSAYRVAAKLNGSPSDFKGIVITAQVPKCFDPKNVAAIFTVQGDLLIKLGALGNCGD